MTKAMTKTERALDRAWSAAAARGDTEALSNLRLAFEALWPIDVKLSPRAVEHLLDCYPDETAPGGFSVLGQRRVVFHDPADARDAAERLADYEDDAVMFALANVNADLSDQQEALLERSVRGSITAAVRTLRQRARNREHQMGGAA